MDFLCSVPERQPDNCDEGSSRSSQHVSDDALTLSKRVHLGKNDEQLRAKIKPKQGQQQQFR